jgi:hypothetical protein
MRTLQEKYNGINEGKFSKDQFLRDARMEQPTLVTQYNGYDDAVQILKNRGMIQEALADYSKVLELPNGNYFAIDGDWEDEYQGKSGLFFTVKGNTIYDKSGQAIQSSPREFISQFTPEEILKVENVNEARLTKNNLTDYRYKATNDMDKYPYEQILRGLRVELEGLNVLGTPTPEQYTKALGKVLKNLEKDSIFYTNQVAGVKANKKRTDVMVDATPKNEVDKENGLQKAALKEAIKGVIKNILSEGVNLSPEGPQMFEDEVYEMQGPKSDNEYKSELADYLEDNQIYGYTDMVHDIMTGPDEEDNIASLADFLDDHQIYGYNKGIERIFADYPYDQHWQNQPDEDEDLPDEIPGFEGTRDALNNLFEDTEADKNMVRKFMTMYETEPSKFEKLHKQAQVQAATTSNIKFKHLLSLIDRAKAGALQSLANQDRYQAGIEGIDESVSLKDIL